MQLIIKKLIGLRKVNIALMRIQLDYKQLLYIINENKIFCTRFNGNKKLQKLKDYFMGQQQLQDDCLQKRALEDLIQSDNEEIILSSQKKVKGEDSDSTIDKMEQLYGSQPLMLTNTLVENDGMIQLIDDHPFNDICFD